MTDHPLTENRVQIIENARLDDIRPGDHITFTSRVDLGGAILTWAREGIAHHRTDRGDWRAEDDVRITGDEGAGEGTTITIRRPVQDLPTVPSTVIVANDGYEAIEATGSPRGNKWRTKEAVLGADGLWHGVWREDTRPLSVASYVAPKHITPGTWTAENLDGDA